MKYAVDIVQMCSVTNILQPGRHVDEKPILSTVNVIMVPLHFPENTSQYKQNGYSWEFYFFSFGVVTGISSLLHFQMYFDIEVLIDWMFMPDEPTLCR